MYHNLDLLIESFTKFVNAFRAEKIYGNFDITYRSFAYEPSTRRYVFIDIDKLEPIQPNNITVMTAYKAVNSFLKSLEKGKIVLTKEQLDDLKKLGGTSYSYHSDLISNSRRSKLTMVEDIYLYKRETRSSPVTIKIWDKKDHFELKISHASNKISFDQVQLKDSFSIYFCRQEGSNDLQCSDINEEKIETKLNKEYYIEQDQVVDFEVQEYFAQSNDWNKDAKKPIFYEIYIISKSKGALGVLRSKTYYTPNSAFQFTNKDLVFRETNDNKLMIHYHKKDYNGYKTLNIKLTELNSEILDKIIQISPNHLQIQRLFNNFNVKRILYLPELAKKSIFLYDILKNDLNSIFTLKLEF